MSLSSHKDALSMMGVPALEKMSGTRSRLWTGSLVLVSSASS